MATAILSMQVFFQVTSQSKCMYVHNLDLQDIKCTGYVDGQLKKAPQAISQYCWVSGTYTVAKR